MHYTYKSLLVNNNKLSMKIQAKYLNQGKRVSRKEAQWFRKILNNF